ncbi:MAG: two-component system histidine kinase PnpS [Nitrospiria bacterium]
MNSEQTGPIDADRSRQKIPLKENRPQNKESFRATPVLPGIHWESVGPFLLLAVLLILLMNGLIFWLFDPAHLKGSFFRLLVLSAGASLILSLLLGIYFSRRRSATLRQMNLFVQKFSKEEMNAAIRTRHADGMESLREAINEMVGHVRKRIETLSSDRAKSVAILSGMVEGVMVLDGKGRVVLTNASFEKMFGVSQTDLTGRYHYERLRHHPLNELIEEVIQTGRPLSEEIGLDTPYQQYFQVQASVAESPPNRFVVLVFHNITENKRQERIRRDFIANVSHELRTPVSVIKGYSETLSDGGLEDQTEAQAFMEIIRKNSIRLENIILDLLQLSRIESGLDPIRPTRITLKDAIEKNILLLKPLANKKQQRFSVSVPPAIRMWADAEKFSLVLINIIDNAVKYTPESGEIRIHADEKETDIRIEIEDDGIGIPKEDLYRIFERFYRVDRTRSRELGGTGLGLSIVKKIVEAHGGEVMVESRIGKGSRFILTFPRHVPQG